MNKKVTWSLPLIAALLVNTVEAANLSQISKKFQEVTPFKVISVEKSEHPDFIQIISDKGIFYSSKDGEILISGSLHEFKPGLKNLTKSKTDELAGVQFNDLKESFITFQASDQKHEIVVFYDSSCPYCTKLHSEVASLNSKGVTVHYAAWPRDGVVSTQPDGISSFTAGYNRMMNLWCSDAPTLALNMVNRGVELRPANCSNKIQEHFDLGQTLGVRGTPAIFNINGKKVVDGYMPAASLLNKLEEQG